MTAELTHKLYVTDGDVIHAAEDPRDVLAFVDHRNPLADDWQIPAQVAANQRLVIWSGTLAGGDDLFVSHPQNWLIPGRQAIEAFSERVSPMLKRSHQRLAIRPHARHILSDGPSTLSFLNKHLTEPFDLALDPAALIESTMKQTVAEHLERIFESLGGRAAMVIVSVGDLQSTGFQDWIGRYVPASTPIVLNAEKGSRNLFSP